MDILILLECIFINTVGHVKNNEAPQKSTCQGILFGSGMFCTGFGQKKWSYGMKVGVYFSHFMAILSHFGIIIFDMTPVQYVHVVWYYKECLEIQAH